MIKCPNCENILLDGSAVCEKCGFIFANRTPRKTSKKPVLRLSKPLKIIIPVVAVILVVALVIGIISGVSGSGKGLSHFGYIRDGEIFISNNFEGSGLQVSDNFVDNKGVIYSYALQYTRTNNDGSRIFFIDKYDGSSYNLYYKNTDTLDNRSIKITANILSYDINDAGTVVTYTKKTGDLFQHDLSSQSDKIDTNVKSFYASDDGKTVIYVKEETESNGNVLNLYLYNQGKKTKKIASTIDFVKKVSDDLSTVYYLSAGSLYKLSVNKEPKKLFDNVTEVIMIYNSGEIYFTRTGESTSTLHYYDGKKTTDLLEGYFNNFQASKSGPALLLSNYSTESSTFYVFIKDKKFSLDYNIVSVHVSDNFDEIFFLANFNTATRVGDLYTAKIDKTLGDVKKIAGNVASGTYLAGEKFVYFTDYDLGTQTATLYTDGKEVAKDVYISKLAYIPATEQLFYFTDVSKTIGTLNMLMASKSSKVMDNIYTEVVDAYSNDSFMFLHDYVGGSGILYAYTNGKLVKIDHDVSEVFKMLTNYEYDLNTRSDF